MTTAQLMNGDMMNDYTLLSDNDLDVEIAKRLGWLVRVATEKDREGSDYRVSLFDDKGNYVHSAYYPSDKSLAAVFSHVSHLSKTPCWSTETDDALRLIATPAKDIGFHLTNLIWADGSLLWRVYFQFVNEHPARHVSDAKTPARAICEAWLRYQDVDKSSLPVTDESSHPITDEKYDVGRLRREV